MCIAPKQRTADYGVQIGHHSMTLGQEAGVAAAHLSNPHLSCTHGGKWLNWHHIKDGAVPQELWRAWRPA